MNFLVLSCALVLAGIAAVRGQDDSQAFYASRYDYLDIQAILSSKRLVRNYVDCLLNQKPCSPEGKALRRILPEGLRTKCARCTERQKHSAMEILRGLRNHYPAEWAKLSNKWDPTGEYTRRFVADLEIENRFGIPSEPAEPVQPVQPMDPVQPVQPVQPIRPTARPTQATTRPTQPSTRPTQPTPRSTQPTMRTPRPTTAMPQTMRSTTPRPQIMMNMRPVPMIPIPMIPDPPRPVVLSVPNEEEGSPSEVQPTLNNPPAAPTSTRQPETVRSTVMTTASPSTLTMMPMTTSRSRPKSKRPRQTTRTPEYVVVSSQPVMGLIDHLGNKIIRTTELVTGLLKNTVRIVIGGRA